MPERWHVRDLQHRFHHPVERVFDYLSSPVRRPEWQSSLRRVEFVGGQRVGVGTTWRDVTWAGARPLLTVTTHEPATEWAERGTWSGITATLDLLFVPDGDQTDVQVIVRIAGAGWQRGLAAGLVRAIPLGLPGDLARADRILARPGPPAA
ncbi:MAG: SRPBCC family protein [Nocardioidaceae bacterium]